MQYNNCSLLMQLIISNKCYQNSLLGKISFLIVKYLLDIFFPSMLLQVIVSLSVFLTLQTSAAFSLLAEIQNQSQCLIF